MERAVVIKQIRELSMFYVYFIQQDGNGRQPIKIGYSENVEKRVTDLQTGNPVKLSIRMKIPCDDKAQAVHIERILHRIAGKKYRSLEGEWFLIYGSWKSLLDAAYKSSTKLDEYPEPVIGKKKLRDLEMDTLKIRIQDLERQLEAVENSIEELREGNLLNIA